jgi:hypothetical protein
MRFLVLLDILVHSGFPCSIILLFFPLQARILALNAAYFLKTGGHFVLSIKV